LEQNKNYIIIILKALILAYKIASSMLKRKPNNLKSVCTSFAIFNIPQITPEN